ncbi:MAG: hypothetical protein IPK73_24935 [Candidatus Obscuribacter sp.]|nr:hypothetical protein [Candidatus Obscuribacter sp.]MBK9277363.1 hypothetical protein [Candidatus Obscuribacter sp.]
MSKQNQVDNPQGSDASLKARRQELEKVIILVSFLQFLGIGLIVAFMPVRVDGALQFSYHLWQDKSAAPATEIFLLELLILTTLTNIPMAKVFLKHRNKLW